MNHQLNSLFRSREAAASLSQAVLPPPPNIFCMQVSFRHQSQTSLDRARKKTHDCKFNKNEKKIISLNFQKNIQTKHLSKNRETCRVFSLCYNYHGTSVPGHSDDCARSTFSCKHPANVKNYLWSEVILTLIEGEQQLGPLFTSLVDGTKKKKEFFKVYRSPRYKISFCSVDGVRRDFACYRSELPYRA